MKPSTFCLMAVVPLLSAASAPAQVTIPVTPTTPTEFTTKRVGSSTAGTGATVAPPPPAVRTTITYLTLSPLRTWVSTDGKPLNGKLIAWEQSVTSVPAGSAVAAPEDSPPVTTRPTVVRNGKIRLLVNGKAFEIPLSRLGPEDQEFVSKLQAATAPDPAAQTSAP